MTKDPELDKQEKKRVLVVAVEPIVRYGLSQLIKLQSDLEVCGEQNAGDGIVEEIVSKQPDLLIIDPFLISTGIFHLLQTILVQSPGLKILVLSRYDEFVYAPRVLKLGAKGYLRKGTTTEQLLAAIRQILREEIFASQELRKYWLDSFLGTPSNVPTSPLTNLSDRELEIFQLLGQGYSTAEIAATLHRSVKTIESNRKHIKQKLKSQTTAKLIQQAVQWNTACTPAYRTD